MTFHNSEDYPAEGNNAQLLAVGQETVVQLKGNVIRCSNDVLELSLEKRQCAHDNEIKLEYFQYYSPFNCLTECRMKYIIQKCNCIPFYYPTPPGIVYKQLLLLITGHLLLYNLFMLITEMPVCNISKIECLMDQVGKLNIFLWTKSRRVNLPNDNIQGNRISTSTLFNDYYALMRFPVIQNDSSFDTKYCKCLVLCEDNYFDIMASSSYFGQPQHFMSSFL